MRKMLKASSLLICAMLLFSACASSLNLRPGPFRSEMQDVFVQQTTLTVPASHAEHGEDYVIEWQDPVMEQHVRKWLDRPKGDIYHSDVWDYQRVTINSGTGIERTPSSRMHRTGWTLGETSAAMSSWQPAQSA